jgi:hypothetical protein
MAGRRLRQTCGAGRRHDARGKKPAAAQDTHLLETKRQAHNRKSIAGGKPAKYQPHRNKEHQAGDESKEVCFHEILKYW